MSQIQILKRAVVVVLIASAAGAILVPRTAPAGTSLARAAIDHGAVLTLDPASAVSARKSPRRVLPAETTATMINVVGLRTRA